MHFYVQYILMIGFQFERGEAPPIEQLLVVLPPLPPSSHLIKGAVALCHYQY